MYSLRLCAFAVKNFSMGEYFHSVRLVPERCNGRMACLKACPTEAIRVRNGRAQILEDRCIDCGECARVCTQNAIVPQTSSLTDFSRFKYTVALISPVLYGQFRKEALPGSILAGVRKIGFDEACDVARASEAVSIAIDEYLASHRGPWPLLSPFCPTIVRLIQARYSDLIDLLIPIDSPMEIAAREVRHRKMKELGLRREEIGVIYLTPCPPKMVAIKYPPRKKASHIDGAIGISEIYHPLLSAIHELSEGAREDGEPVTGIGLGWPLLGGQVSSLEAQNSLAVGGLDDVERILDEIEHGKLGDIQYVECHATGTSLGDKVELNSMDAFFGKFGASPMAGSVKSNLGHLLTAAGMASMTKVILSMEAGVIPATIHLEDPQTSANHVITADRIPASSVPWPETGSRKRAAVSAFGLGGTNAHLILEEGEGGKTETGPASSFNGDLSGEHSPAAARARSPMAIIAMEAHFGTCPGLSAFHRTVYEGIQHFIPLPPDRWKGLEALPELL